MGLSSSQARLLNLTNRMHQIEYNAARIEAMKLQMANESRRVYEDYLEALDQAKIQKKTLTTNGAVTFVDMKKYDDFLNAGFAIVVHGLPDTYTPDKTNPDRTAYNELTATQKIAKWAAYAPAVSDPDYASYSAMSDDQKVAYLESKIPGGLDSVIPPTVPGSPVTTTNGSKVCYDIDSLVGAIKEVFKGENGQPLDIRSGLEKHFEETLTNLINSGACTIIQKPQDPSKYGDDQFENGFPKVGSQAFEDWETSVAINTSLQEVQDEVKLRKAEAKYEADMKRIDMKDRRYDADLAALDNERNAIKQEMETLKTVARDNVDRTFKIFS